MEGLMARPENARSSLASFTNKPRCRRLQFIVAVLYGDIFLRGKRAAAAENQVAVAKFSPAQIIQKQQLFDE